MGDDTIKEIKSNHFFNRDQVSNFLKKLASEIINGKIEIQKENIEIPEQLEVEYIFKEKKNQNKFKIEIKW